MVTKSWDTSDALAKLQLKFPIVHKMTGHLHRTMLSHFSLPTIALLSFQAEHFGCRMWILKFCIQKEAVLYFTAGPTSGPMHCCFNNWLFIRHLPCMMAPIQILAAIICAVASHFIILLCQIFWKIKSPPLTLGTS